MTLGGLLRAFADRSGVPVPPLDGAAEATVSSISYDSRKARPGSVFVALRGMHADGTAFAREAISRGAVAALSESAAPSDVRVVWVQVPDARMALAALAAIFYGDPSEQLVLVGITGTNGKTTTSYLLASVFEAARHHLRTDWNRRLSDRPEGNRSGANHPGGAGAPGDASRHGVAGLRRLRDGSVVARAGVEARRLPAVRGSHLYQPDPRSPRLPPQHGRLLRGQAEAVRAVAGGGGRRREPGRSTWCRPVVDREACGHLCDRRRRGRPAAQPDLDPGRAPVRCRRRRAGRCTSNRGWSGEPTPTTSSQPSRPPPPSICR